MDLELDRWRSGGVATRKADWETPLTSDSAVSVAPPALVNALQDRYSVEHELGSGGMATVYLARDLRHGSYVAVKVLRPDLVPLFGAQRFTREIRITAALQHPGILPVLDSGQVDGIPYYLTPFIDGESLAQRLKREEQLAIEDALDIACQIADALSVAHARGFVHRDVKPGNILLQGKRVILTDFGIARAVDVVTAEKLTESGMALGTPAYMSPEQSACGHIDGRTDLYSLGCVLFEMLAGSPPFTGPTAQSVRARHAVDPPPSLRTVRPSVPPSLERVIARLLAKVPADRYATALQFKEALQAIDLNEPITVESRGNRRRAFRAAGVLAAAVLVSLTWHFVGPKAATLDANRIMVFPLVMAAGFMGPKTMGEDVATMVGNALDGAGPLRWTDGWPLLSPRERDDIRGLSLEKAKALARSKRCAYYLMGRLVARGDSMQVFLELDDVRGDTVVARGKAVGPADRAWSLGLHAVNDVLPALIPTGAPDITAEWKDRDPGAIANFLLGEAAFRRVHLVEALGHYRDAVKTDSLFGLAAVRGAQAATWNHRPSEAAALIQIAIKRKMPPQYLHFALGYQDYLEGQADAAAAEFHRALDVDPDMAAAWMQLGEVYTHLLPEAGDLQSQAEAAFEEAHRLDPKATNILLHLIEIHLRKGEVAKAQPVVRQFLDASPAADLARQIALMATCAREGPAEINWVRESQENTLAVLLVGHKLAAGGARLDCAVPAFAAVVKSDTSAAGDLRWFALLGLQAALLAQGKVVEAMKEVDSRPAQDGAMAMYLLDAPVFPAVTDKASQVAQSYKRECGPGYSKCANPYRVWQLGIWDALRGHTTEAELAARELGARAGRDTTLSNRHFFELFARSIRAHAALARSDTSTALRLLDASLRDPVPGGENIEWDIAKPRGLDRLRLAQLLLAVGQPQRALDVAQVFDSASPSVYLIYLVESLKVRVDAAGAVGNAMLAAQYRARLSKLRQGRDHHLTEGQEGVT